MKTSTLATLAASIGMATGAVSAAKAETDEETLARFERNLAEAVVKKDVSAIDAMWADDFYVFNSTTGGRATKADLAANLRSKDLNVTAMKFSPFFVRVFGTTAFVQGSNEQTSIRKGKSVRDTFVWFDVFEKRDGRWMWIVSESTRVNARITSKVYCDEAFCKPTQPGFEVKK